MLLEYGYFFG